MESLAPPFKCLLEVRWNLENGHSVRSALHLYLRKVEDKFSLKVADWLILRDQGRPHHELQRHFRTLHQRALIEVLHQGLSGLPILNRIHELESEMQKASEDQIQRHLARLPFIALIPVILIQFPAFLWVLFTPLLHQFTHGMMR